MWKLDRAEGWEWGSGKEYGRDCHTYAFFPSIITECLRWKHDPQLKTNFSDSFAVKCVHMTQLYPMGCELSDKYTF